MIAEFDWWLLIVGFVAGGGLIWLILARLPRTDGDIASEERWAEADWISEELTASGLAVEPETAEAVLALHRRYLLGPDAMPEPAGDLDESDAQAGDLGAAGGGDPGHGLPGPHGEPGEAGHSQQGTQGEVGGAVESEGTVPQERPGALGSDGSVQDRAGGAVESEGTVPQERPSAVESEGTVPQERPSAAGGKAGPQDQAGRPGTGTAT